MTPLCNKLNKSMPTVLLYDIGTTDTKGRVEGRRVTCFELDMYKSETQTSGYRMEPGHYYVVQIQKTKDGVAFGSTQRDYYFKSVSERAYHILKRVKGLTLVEIGR